MRLVKPQQLDQAESMQSPRRGRPVRGEDDYWPWQDNLDMLRALVARDVIAPGDVYLLDGDYLEAGDPPVTPAMPVRIQYAQLVLRQNRVETPAVHASTDAEMAHALGVPGSDLVKMFRQAGSTGTSLATLASHLGVFPGWLHSGQLYWESDPGRGTKTRNPMLAHDLEPQIARYQAAWNSIVAVMGAWVARCRIAGVGSVAWQRLPEETHIRGWAADMGMVADMDGDFTENYRHLLLCSLPDKLNEQVASEAARRGGLTVDPEPTQG